MAIRNAKRPGQTDFPAKPLQDLNLYFIKADAVNYDTTTGEVELFSLPAGTLVHQLGYNVLTAYASSEPTNVLYWLGSTSNYRLYGELGPAQLASTSPGAGSWLVNYESTAESKVVLYVANAGLLPSGGAATAGIVEIWMSYRANSESQRWLLDT